MIAAHPENTAARLLRARAFFAAAQLRPAELEFELVLEREPDNAFAHFALARTFQRSGRSEAAVRHFRLAATRAGTDAYAGRNRRVRGPEPTRTRAGTGPRRHCPYRPRPPWSGSYGGTLRPGW